MSHIRLGDDELIFGGHVSPWPLPAAYLCLPRQSVEKSHRTAKAAPGLVIDFNRRGNPIGIEIMAPIELSAATMNRVLRRLGFLPVTRAELAPIRAA
jgi:hypothetical protein